MINDGCIAIQVHIPPLDEWHGMIGMNESEKVKCVELTLEHTRKKNPNSYISFCGHGLKPNEKYLKLCDYIEWYDFDPIAGKSQMPAQFKYVSKAIKNCKKLGFKKILKLRGDGLYFINNFCNFCDEIIKSENKILLTTQMTTTTGLMGDCLMYGDIDLLNYIWNENNIVVDGNGLIQTSHYFKKYFDNECEWNCLLKKYTSFRDINTLRWMDLRWTGKELMNDWENVRVKILNDTFDYKDYLWGIKPEWIKIDNGELIKSVLPFYTEKLFYKN